MMMIQNKNLPFFTLVLMISFASVNAVLFTPALPAITHFFAISEATAQLTITWFLIGYALGQLLYGPIANRFGRKKALYIGICLQIWSSLLCVAAAKFDSFALLVLGRFLLALGSGVGLKMTFTLISECYEPKIASQKISYLMLSFAITPGLAVALGGLLLNYFTWTSCFYAGAIYGIVLLLFVTQLPETQTKLDLHALQMKHLTQGYATQFKNWQLLSGGLLMGGSTCFVYMFAAIAPFLAMNLLGMSSSTYGMANLLPPIGLIFGSITSAKLIQRFAIAAVIKLGIAITFVGVLLMLIANLLHSGAITSLFFPMIVMYFGVSLVLANASMLAMANVSDKAHGSAVMNFLNMGFATIGVLLLGLFMVKTLLLPCVYLIMCVIMWLAFKRLANQRLC